MRSIVADIPTANYAPGDAARLYGPNADGTLNSSAPETFGAAAVMPFVHVSGWCEDAWGMSAWCGGVEQGGWCGERWAMDAWCQPPARSRMIGRPLEFGCYQHAVQVQTRRGTLSLIGSAAGVLINSGPSKPVRTAVAVALGVVTMTVTESA